MTQWPKNAAICGTNYRLTIDIGGEMPNNRDIPRPACGLNLIWMGVEATGGHDDGTGRDA